MTHHKERIAQRNAHIRQDAKRGIPAGPLANRYGLSRASIYLIAGDILREQPDPRPKPTRHRNREIRKKAREGATSRELQETYGLGYDSIWKIAGDILRQQPPQTNPAPKNP